MTWTPGPWTVAEEDGDTLAITPIAVHAPFAYLGLDRHDDARLIAAAPEMAALLMAPGTYPDYEWVEQRDALLARIRGEA
jgi:hypothetical protein